MESLAEIKEKENNGITKTIHKFAVTTAIFCFVFFSFYLFLGLYYPAFLVLSIGILFLMIIYLNNHSHQVLARVLTIFTTNIGILLFSPYIGFDGGLYLYLFTAPQLIFLLFKNKQKGITYFCMGINLTTCILIYLIDKFHWIESIDIESGIVQLIFSVNFIFSFIFSFILVSIFAKNNEIYIDMLTDVNLSLSNQQEILKIEILEKNKMNLALKKSIKEKETLLSEVHHRVKNNLAVISGLLELENLFIKEKSISDILKDSKNRVKSIALLHEKLYQHQNFDKIDIKNYINELLHFIQLSYSKEDKNVTIHTDIESIFLTMDLATPFSLLVNELITNSYKHAFNEVESGTIYIKLHEKNDGLIFEYSDNGIGFDMNEALKKDSIGINLINAFINQLEGKFENFSKIGEGCKLNLYFKDI